MRPLRSDDHGLFDLLAVLTSSPDMGAGAFERRFAELREHKDTYFIIVITDEKDDKRLVATGTVFTEPKFLRGCSKVGHIEDIAVSKEMQGKGLGKVLINILTDLSERVGCYKVRSRPLAFSTTRAQAVQVPRPSWTATPKTKVSTTARASVTVRLLMHRPSPQHRLLRQVRVRQATWICRCSDCADTCTPCGRRAASSTRALVWASTRLHSAERFSVRRRAIHDSRRWRCTQLERWSLSLAAVPSQLGLASPSSGRQVSVHCHPYPFCVPSLGLRPPPARACTLATTAALGDRRLAD